MSSVAYGLSHFAVGDFQAFGRSQYLPLQPLTDQRALCRRAISHRTRSPRWDHREVTIGYKGGGASKSRSISPLYTRAKAVDSEGQTTVPKLGPAFGLAERKRLRMASSTSVSACLASRASVSAACARNSAAVNRSSTAIMRDWASSKALDASRSLLMASRRSRSTVSIRFSASSSLSRALLHSDWARTSVSRAIFHAAEDFGRLMHKIDNCRCRSRAQNFPPAASSPHFAAPSGSIRDYEQSMNYCGKRTVKKCGPVRTLQHLKIARLCAEYAKAGLQSKRARQFSPAGFFISRERLRT